MSRSRRLTSFPCPTVPRSGAFRMEVSGRTIKGTLEERAKARQDYDTAIAAGQHEAIAEEERPGVFTLRVGNIMPGEEASVHLDMTGVLPYSGGEVTFRFPLVVAPRYIPGTPLSGRWVGDGTAVDTDAVPDASRISPPVLLQGFPNPVRLSLAIDLYDDNRCVATDGVRSSLHAILTEEKGGFHRIRLDPGDRLTAISSSGSASAVATPRPHPLHADLPPRRRRRNAAARGRSR